MVPSLLDFIFVNVIIASVLVRIPEPSPSLSADIAAHCNPLYLPPQRFSLIVKTRLPSRGI
jgi:hypothetical protein